MEAANKLVFGARLDRLDPEHQIAGWAATARTRSDNKISRKDCAERFDAVILAMPPSNAARIKGHASRLIKAQRPRGIRWISRFSMALWWPAGDAAVSDNSTRSVGRSGYCTTNITRDTRSAHFAFLWIVASVLNLLHSTSALYVILRHAISSKQQQRVIVLGPANPPFWILCTHSRPQC